MSIEFRRPFNINNLIFIVKDENILNFIYIIDLNFIILQFEFLTKKLILNLFVILMKIMTFDFRKMWFYGFDQKKIILTENCVFAVLTKNTIL